MIVAPPSTSKSSEGLRPDLHSKSSAIKGIDDDNAELNLSLAEACGGQNDGGENAKGKNRRQSSQDTVDSETLDLSEEPREPLPAPNNHKTTVAFASPATATAPPTPHIHKPLKPLLKSPGSSSKKAKGARRVRGLWKGDATDHFANLRDETLQHVISFLSMGDICALSGVSSRWRYLALDPSCWKHVDATDFAHRLHSFCSSSNSSGDACKATAEVLTKRLTSRTPETLTIRSIHSRIHPEYYLPSIHAGLHELTLAEHSLLSDTHVHVMFMSFAVLGARSKSNHNNLRKLALDHCPLLTNACVQSIASQCKRLEELSLCGCKNVTDILPLESLFKLVSDEEGDNLPAKRGSADSTGSLQSLFSSPAESNQPSSLSGLSALFPTTAPRDNPPTAASGLSSLFAPPPPSDPPNASPGLSSLFAPPPPNPPIASPGLSSPIAPPPLSDSPPALGLVSLFEPPKQTEQTQKASAAGGRLSRLNLSFTGVTAQALVTAFRAAPGKVVLDMLEMKGSGESWTDSVFSSINQCQFKVFDIGCGNPRNGSHGVTDLGLRELATQADMERIGLSGQKGIQSGLHTTLSNATRLHSLNLESCSSLFAGDVSDMVPIIEKTTTLQYLNLSRCFSDETKAGASSPQVFQADEERGKRFLNAICASGSRFTLRELDLSWCWFVTASEVAQVRRACPRLERLHLLGTRCNQVI